MEVVSPSQSHHTPATSFFSRISLVANLRRASDRRNRASPFQQLEDTVEETDGEVFVALGKSLTKSVALLQWTLRKFPSHHVCILHVHQPSPFIPTPLGKLPARQANDIVVASFRNQEREATKKLLNNYDSICSNAKIKPHFITIEADQVQNGIVDMVKNHNIDKLVVGASPESSKKASYAAKHAPPFCKMWFINNGKHVWTRESPETSSFIASSIQAEPPPGYNLRSRSLQPSRGESLLQSEYLHSSSNRSLIHPEHNLFAAESTQMEVGSLNANQIHNFDAVHGTTSLNSSDSEADSSMFQEGMLLGQLAAVMVEADFARSEAIFELLKCNDLEDEALDAIDKARILYFAHEREAKLRVEAEDSLRCSIEEQENVIKEREELTNKLQKTMRNIAVLDTRALETDRRCKEVAEELQLIQDSIATLRHEKNKIKRQKTEALKWIDNWKTHGQAARQRSRESIVEASAEIAEFSFQDLQSATCNFSENFRIGHGGYGAVYKGELLGVTVAIKKMNPHNAQRLSDFHHQGQLLCNLRHPHLVSLIGICEEACSLVYEYLPGGNLQDRFFGRSMAPLNWKTRTLIISGIASALFFLHTFYPEEIVHGNLKPENILLDSNISCKVSDIANKLVLGQNLYFPKGAFPYMDPEFHFTRILTPKSDIYSFGIIILQLLTGRTPGQLSYEVRKEVSRSNLSSILDPSAGEWSMFVARRLMELGLQCCELNSRDRPELTPNLLHELEQLHSLEEKSIPSFFLCPIFQEMMHDPQIAADGFTYEGEALRGWFENGHDTSPMTNLKLRHLNLTPNHSLRLAIQEWIISRP